MAEEVDAKIIRYIFAVGILQIERNKTISPGKTKTKNRAHKDDVSAGATSDKQFATVSKGIVSRRSVL